MSSNTRVVVKSGEEKENLLDSVLEESNFFEILDKRLAETKKSQDQFLIAIKPNIMMGYSKRDPSTITDPSLVEHLVDKIIEKGYTNIAIVESQNVFSNWFKNRDVTKVADYFGYSSKNYRIVDLTKEKAKYDYKNRLGKHWVGPTWRDADFRISFAKNKTHFSCYFTLTIKNLYGCTPLQNKFKEYHKIREFDWPTIEMLKHFPCHYGLIDAFISADGIWGLKSDETPVDTETIIGGENIIAVEAVGAEKMGLNPVVSRIFNKAVDAFGLPEIERVGDLSEYENWRNVPPGMDKALDIGEEFYNISNLLGFISSDMDPYFEVRTIACFAQALRKLMVPLQKVLSRMGF
ncbi:MAG: hypothetical protein HeimC3_32320 [Candidatus Heimdallarchaeota archaeon LC_3]|nr:MAG: hypothetical protein HeimC3_32320 [Candidatus Heimdallarchaeota archaeon LC_3]